MLEPVDFQRSVLCSTMHFQTIIIFTLIHVMLSSNLQKLTGLKNRLPRNANHQGTAKTSSSSSNHNHPTPNLASVVRADLEKSEAQGLKVKGASGTIACVQTSCQKITEYTVDESTRFNCFEKNIKIIFSLSEGGPLTQAYLTPENGILSVNQQHIEQQTCPLIRR